MLKPAPLKWSADLSERPREQADGPGDRAGRVAIVLVNWNGWRDTLACYESLTSSSFRDWEVICVDNASTDESIAALREPRPRFRLIESQKNLGFAGGCNLGIEAARSRGAEYIYLLNNDATVCEQTLAVLVETSQSLGDACVLGTLVRVPSDGTLQFWGSRKSNEGLPMQFAPSEERLAQSPDLIETDFILGASLFIPRAILEKVGVLDDRYFLNFEETDWCYRARRANYRCLVLKNALVFHEGGAAIGHPEGPLQVYFTRRNRLLFCERNVSPPRFALLYLRQAAGALWRLMMALAPGASPALSLQYRAHAMGTFDYMLRRFGDCPPVIRKMASEYRDAIGAGSNPAALSLRGASDFDHRTGAV
jgi:GT2 family glycosyltransferase